MMREPTHAHTIAPFFGVIGVLYACFRTYVRFFACMGAFSYALKPHLFVCVYVCVPYEHFDLDFFR